jgi:5-deoxy-glucuronate isomerase
MGKDLKLLEAAMGALITDHRKGFGPGFTAITSIGGPDDDSGIALGVLKLPAGGRYTTTPAGETAWLLMAGHASGRLGDIEFDMSRNSLFDDSPSCLHAPAGTRLEVACKADTEFTVYACANSAHFAPRWFRAGDTGDERRGEGQVGGRCLRIVRTIFDGSSSPPEAQLVLGEVLTLPGGWSSYPPHHHPQPEIYHYRFTHPQGFGHAELGEQVFRVRQYDTIRILAGNDHAQCAAPGYGMYYSWVIRHLPGNPYTVPEFTADHAWTMERGATIWEPGPAPPAARRKSTT